MNKPPVAKYELTVKIRGNSHEEVVDELATLVNGGYLLNSDYGRRDSFDSTGGRDRAILVHANPGMTPERYRAELEQWAAERKRERAQALLCESQETS